MMAFVLSFVLIALVMASMAIGVIFGRGPSKAAAVASRMGIAPV